MSDATRRQRLDRIVAASAAMLEKARAGEWTAVIGLEAERAQDIAQLFATPVTADEAVLVAASLERILALDAELMALGQAAHREVTSELGAQQQGKQAERAYRHVLGT